MGTFFQLHKFNTERFFIEESQKHLKPKQDVEYSPHLVLVTSFSIRQTLQLKHTFRFEFFLQKGSNNIFQC